MAERQVILGVGEYTSKGLRIDSRLVIPKTTRFEEVVEQLRVLIEEDDLNEVEGEDDES